MILRLWRAAVCGLILAGCGALPHGGVPACGITDTSRGTAFCETAAEVALHETPVHIASIPDAMFILNDQSFTLAPGDAKRPVYPEASARSRIQMLVQTYPSLPPGSSVGTGTLAELHSKDGIPAAGQLVWVFPIHVPTLPKPPSSNAGTAGGTAQYVWAIVDGETGSLVGIYTA